MWTSHCPCPVEMMWGRRLVMGGIFLLLLHLDGGDDDDDESRIVALEGNTRRRLDLN
jgi:hypothetical protein